jgi:hypothetical protein
MISKISTCAGDRKLLTVLLFGFFKVLLGQKSAGRHFLVRQNHYGYFFASSETTLVSVC